MFRFSSSILCLLCVLQFSSASSQNYDESKVPSYSLPELTQANNGTRITDVEGWEARRRPEILKLFEEHVYGQMPTTYDSIRYVVKRQDSKAMMGRAQLKEISILVYKGVRNIEISLVLFVPQKINKPVPVFLLVNNRGRSNTDPQRKTKSEFWPAEMVIDNGYAIAAFHVSDAAPDNKDNYTNGVLQLYPEQIGDSSGMKAIGAWAWAASRVMDYFETDKSIDSKKVAVVGHSRGGKASLWAGAQDRRFSMVISNCSGNSGAALSRRRFGETIAVINSAFPHWFADNYKRYNDRESALPVDQHMLLALIAPRPVYVTNATRDLWADPRGSYLSLKQAEEIYRLYNKDLRLPVNPPPINSAIINSIAGYHNREGDHDLTRFDWLRFVEFAKHHFQ